MPDERLVVAQAAAGDRRAFEQIYRAYASTLFSYVLVPIKRMAEFTSDCVALLLKVSTSVPLLFVVTVPIVVPL